MKKQNNLTLDELINEITSSVDPSWDTLKKIRYVYIELGKYLEKNTEFFMSVMHKVKKEHELSPNEIEKIYKDDLEDGNRKDWNKVICRSAAILLSKCLNKLNIENKMITSKAATSLDGLEDEDFEIKHVFINAKLDDDRSIFLTLAADLPFIQNNFRTCSFGNLIRYERIDEDGTKHQVYEGPEVKDLVEINKEELLKIDTELGYTYMLDENEEVTYVYGNYFFDSIKKKLAGNKLYYDLLSRDTFFYKNIFGDKSFKADIKSIREFKNIVYESCKYISDYINFDFNNYKKNGFNYNEWHNNISLYVENLRKNNEKCGEGERSFENILKVNDSFVNIVGDLAAMILSDSVNQENLKQCRNKFNKKLLYLSRLFIDEEYLPNHSEDGLIKQNYISKKLETIFKYVFSCNEEITDFNKLAYNEQITLIRLFIPIVFGDINLNDCYKKTSNPPIYNIIRTYTYRMMNDGSYELVFEIDNNDVKDYYTYNLSSNKFKRITQTRFYFTAIRNIICSKDLKDRLNIEKETEAKKTL